MCKYTEKFFTNQDYLARTSKNLDHLMELLKKPVTDPFHYNARILSTIKIAEKHQGIVSFKQDCYKIIIIEISFKSEALKKAFEEDINANRELLMLTMLIT